MTLHRSLAWFISILLVAGLTGCSGSATNTPTEQVTPLKSTDLSMTSVSTGKADELHSANLARVADMLVNRRVISNKSALMATKAEGVGGFIAEILIAIIETAIHSKEVDGVKKEIEDVNSSIDKLSAKIDDLSKELNIKFDKIYYGLSDEENKKDLQQYKGTISSAFFGSTKDSLSYFNQQTLLITQCKETPGYPDTCTDAQKNAYNNASSLPANATSFVNNHLADVQKSVLNINQFIVGDVKLLNTSARNILSQLESQNIVIDSDRALNVYLMLEKVFSQLLAYQFQGAIIIANANNYQTPGNYYNSNNYLTGDFEHYIRQECAEFLAQVQWLAVNMRDYRDKSSYATDMNYTAQGLAPDPVYTNMLARSRFFCAQVLQHFTTNRDNGGFTADNGVKYPPDTTYYNNKPHNDELYRYEFGLYGAIVVPYNYTFDHANKKSMPVTLELYDSNNALVATVNSQPGDPFSRQIKGRFPNTAWNTNTKGVLSATEDHQWLFYDFDFSNAKDSTGAKIKISAGTYSIKFQENGTNAVGAKGPWVHTSTNLGTLKVLYFEPQNPDKGQINADTTHTVLFGYFSLYWPWGFQVFSASPASSWNGINDFNHSDTFVNYINLPYNHHTTFDWSKDIKLLFNVGQAETDTSTTKNVAFMFNSSKNYMSASNSCTHGTLDTLSYKYSINDSSGKDIVIDSKNGPAAKHPATSKIDTHSTEYKSETINYGDYHFTIHQTFSGHLPWPYYGCTAVDFESSLNWNIQLLFPSAALNIIDI